RRLKLNNAGSVRQTLLINTSNNYTLWKLRAIEQHLLELAKVLPLQPSKTRTYQRILKACDIDGYRALFSHDDSGRAIQELRNRLRMQSQSQVLQQKPQVLDDMPYQ